MDSSARRKVAVFVDFDNAFSGLRERSPAAAEAFGSGPRTWLRWLEEGMPASFAQGGALERAILVRRCYLNPGMYGRYRQCFAEAGFQVTDCPPLTGNGKTSADMLMVLEIMDALQRQLYDEFIIFSGDADFTPILLRLRAHDHRTAVIATGNYARVMHGAADVLIDSDIFMRFALKIVPDAPGAPARAPEPPARRAAPAAEAASRPPRPAAPRTEKPHAAAKTGAGTSEAAAIIDFLRTCLAEAGQPLSLSSLGMQVRTEFASVVPTKWFGRGGFIKWLQAQRDLPFIVFTHNDGAYLRDRSAPKPPPDWTPSRATPASPVNVGRPASAESVQAPVPLPEPPQPPRPPADERALALRDAADEAGGGLAHTDPAPESTAAEPVAPSVEAEPPHLHAELGRHAGDEHAVPPHDSSGLVLDQVGPAALDDALAASTAAAEAEPVSESVVLDAQGSEVVRVESLFLDLSGVVYPEAVTAEPESAEADHPDAVAFDGEVKPAPMPFLDWSPLFPEEKTPGDSLDGYQTLITEEPAAEVEVARATCNACGAALRPGHPCCMACRTPI